MWNESIERLSQDELKRLQWQRLQTLLNRLNESVPFYKERLGKLSINSLDDLRKLPFTTKSDLRDHYPFDLLMVGRSEVRRIHASSGTRGKPTLAAYTDSDLKTWAQLCARSLVAAGVKPKDVVQDSYGYGLFTGGLGLHYGAEELGATVIPASAGRTQQQILLLKDLGARVLCCTPSYALNLAMALSELDNGRTKLALEIGVLGGEPWTEECRAQIQDKLRIKAYDIYGISEVMGPGVAMECVAQNGLHVWEDHFIAEIVDPSSLEPVEDGAPGELVLTTLTKEAQPLLRYRTGDACQFVTTECSCGRTMRRVTRVQGRLDDMLVIRGVNVYPSEIESIIYSLEELSPQYQIVIAREQALDSLMIRAELQSNIQSQWLADGGEPEKRLALKIRLAERLKAQLGLNAAVELVDPKTLAPSEGKALHVIDLRSTQ